MITKALKVEKIDSDQPSSEGVVLSYIASTSAEDRYGDIVSQNWELDNYKQNPIVLLNHNSQELPIARGSVDVVDGQLLIDVTFDMADPKAAEVARKAKDGFLNAVSVGFNPLQMISRSDLPADHFAHGDRGNFYQSSELLEVSIVTIPANGQATAAKSLSALEDLDLMQLIIDSRINKALEAMKEKHILEVEELEDRFVVSYLKAKPEEAEDAEEAEEIEAEEAEEAEEQEYYKEEEEEDKEKGLSSEEKDFIQYLSKLRI